MNSLLKLVAGCYLTVIGTNALAANEGTVEHLIHLSLQQLLQIETVSTTKTANRLQSAPGIINVFSAEQIQQMGFQKLSDIFWIIPGVQVHQSLSNRTKIWFRGSQTRFNNKAALFINGIPQRDVFGGFPTDWELPIENIKRVEIIRGPGSALYGTNAFSGVINIYTYLPGELQGKSRVQVSMGNLNTQITHLLSDHQASWGSWLVDGSFYQTDGQEYDYSREGLAVHRSAEQRTRNINLSASMLDNRLILQIGHRDFDNLHVRKTNKGVSDHRPSQRNHNTRYADIKYQQPLAHNNSLSYHLYFTETQRHEWENRFLPDGSFQLQEHFTDITRLLGANMLLNYRISPDNQWVIGAEIIRESLPRSDFMVMTPNNTTSYQSIHRREFQHLAYTNQALYAQNTYRFSNTQTTLTSGIRADFTELFGNQINARLGLVNQFNPQWFGKLLFGTGYRSPSFLEFTRTPADNTIPPINDVESMQTIEAQLGYNSRLSTHTLTYFHNNYDDFIVKLGECYPGDNSGISGCGQFAEYFGATGERQMDGWELENKAFFTDQLQGFLNIALTHTQDSRTQQSIPLLADWTLAAGLHWQHSIAGNTLSISPYFYHYSQRKDWDAQYVTYRQPDGSNLRQSDFSDAFTVFNSVLRYQLNNGHFKGTTLELAVNNLFNQQHRNQDLVSHNSRFNNQGQPVPFNAWFDARYDQRSIQFNLNYEW